MWEECHALMRAMYHDCDLVHADFSAYNLLYHQNQLYVIDVGQAVEPSHPFAKEFLYRDCVSITSYFSKEGATNVPTAAELFTDITGLPLTPENEAEIQGRLKTCKGTPKSGLTSAKMDDPLWAEHFIAAAEQMSDDDDDEDDEDDENENEDEEQDEVEGEPAAADNIQ